jgi:Protein of unknown function (DUF3667)
MQITCRNCETAYHETYKYCPECSQKSKLHRLTLHDVVHEGVHYFTHADKGLFQLIRDLMVKTGVVAYEYIEGKRKKYFPPLNFFLLIAAVFVFVASMGEGKVNVDVMKQHPELAKIGDPAARQQAIGVYERKANVAHFTTKYSNLMAMGSLPLTALVFWLFYRKNKYNYIEHLVAGMYMLGFCILIYAGIILPLSFAFGFKGNPAVLLFFVTQILYFTIFYYRFLGKQTKSDFVKALGVSLLSLVVWIAISGSLVRFYIVSGFGGLLK